MLNHQEEKLVLSQASSSVPGREMSSPGFASQFFSSLGASAWEWAKFQGNMLLKWSLCGGSARSRSSVSVVFPCTGGGGQAGCLPTALCSQQGWLKPGVTLWGMHLSTVLPHNPWHLCTYWVLHRSFGMSPGWWLRSVALFSNIPSHWVLHIRQGTHPARSPLCQGSN